MPQNTGKVTANGAGPRMEKLDIAEPQRAYAG